MISHVDTGVLTTIFCAALVTYALRLGGLLMADRLPDNGGFREFMDVLPGTILLSLVAPGIVSAGFWGCVAASVTAMCTWRTNSVFGGMILGMGVVAISRCF